MSNNKSNDPRDYDENGELYTFNDVREKEIHELQKKVEDLQIKSKKQSEKYEELCYENDEDNRKWAEDNERNGDIMAEQQEQIIRLEEENRMLKKTRDEFVDVFKGVSVIVDNPNFPRIGEQILIEMRKLKDEIKTLEERQLPFGWTTNTLKNLQEVRDELKEENTEQSTEIINFEGQIKRLEEENERLEEEKQELQSQADRWEGEHSDLWYSVFGALDDGGYSATSTGQLISFIRDIIEENEKLEEEIKKLKS